MVLKGLNWETLENRRQKARLCYGTVNTYSRTINLPNVISIRVHALWTLPIDPNSEDNIA